MAQEFSPGEIVAQSGIYTITHGPATACCRSRGQALFHSVM